MRVDKFPPRRVYEDFWEWLSWHPFWMINLVFAYFYYLQTTIEV